MAILGYRTKLCKSFKSQNLQWDALVIMCYLMKCANHTILRPYISIVTPSLPKFPWRFEQVPLNHLLYQRAVWWVIIGNFLKVSCTPLAISNKGQGAPVKTPRFKKQKIKREQSLRSDILKVRKKKKSHSLI